jgi:hypothetical protein
MGTKPGIALIGLGLTAITLSGCESLATSRPSKPLGGSVSAWQTTPSSYPASGLANQTTRTTTGNPVASTASGNSTTPSARVTDPGMTSATMGSSVTPASSQSTSSVMSPAGSTAAAPQTPASFPGMPSSQTSSGSVNQSSRMTNSTATQATTPPPSWPSTIPAAGATGTKQSDPPAVNTSQTGESSYQTRYPQLQPSSSVPTTSKSGSTSND